MVDPSFNGFESLPFEDVDAVLQKPTDRRLFAVANAMIDKGYSVDRVWELTKIDKWFLYKLENIVNIRKELAGFKGPTPVKEEVDLAQSPPVNSTNYKLETATLPATVLKKAKKAGFSDKQIADLTKSSELGIRHLRKSHGIIPIVKRIDTLAAEFPAPTNYLFTTYNGTTNDVKFDDKGIVVLGSGVYRIGSSVEFDWCGVSTIRTLKQLGYRTVMVNYNPETVSTDFDECDRLYFEELSFERTMDIFELEQASGIIVSVGGQLPQNIALKLWNQGLNVLGTSPVDVDRAEDREKFSSTLDAIGVDQPDWQELTSFDDAKKFADRVGWVEVKDCVVLIIGLTQSLAAVSQIPRPCSPFVRAFRRCHEGRTHLRRPRRVPCQRRCCFQRVPCRYFQVHRRCPRTRCRRCGPGWQARHLRRLAAH